MAWRFFFWFEGNYTHLKLLISAACLIPCCASSSVIPVTGDIWAENGVAEWQLSMWTQRARWECNLIYGLSWLDHRIPLLFFPILMYTLPFISWCGSTACCFMVTAEARAAPCVCKPSLRAATPEKGMAPTVDRGGVTCLQLICCTHIKDWNTCLFILGNFLCLKYFGKKPKPLSE